MRSARILWVGGHESDHAILVGLLRGVGLGDVQFVVANQAVSAVATRGVDLILLDLVQNSTDVFRVLRAAVPRLGDVRVPVMVTAPSDVPDRIQACLQRGADDYLITPFDAANPMLVTRRIELCLTRQRLRDYTVELKNANANGGEIPRPFQDATTRFVPSEFLENLQRKTLDDVRLGDHVQRNMTVFFSDIRDFTALSEQLTPQQNFNFLNSYLQQVTPIIRAHHGFVDKYIGDAIMALFPKEPDDALTGAIEVQRQLARYNEGRKMAGYIPIRIGIGLHRGELILGTIGEEERMQTTVIADAVNVASRIEGLTKTFGVSLLVSGTVVNSLRPDHAFKLRHLGAVKTKGKLQSVEIYECFTTDPPDIARHKEETAGAFVAAMAEFRKGMFLTAGRIFAHIADLNHEDRPAAHFRDSCTLSAVRDRGRTRWDGAETIEIK